MSQLTPADLESYIAAHGVRARVLHGLGATPTVPAAAQALGVASDQIIKTLLFLVEVGGAEPRRPVIVIGNGERFVDKRALAAHFGVGQKRVKLAPPDVVLELLGYPAGGVPPFGHRAQVPCLVDQAVVDLRERFGGVIYGGGGDDQTMMELTVDELLRVVQPAVVAVSG